MIDLIRCFVGNLRFVWVLLSSSCPAVVLLLFLCWRTLCPPLVLQASMLEMASKPAPH